MNSLLPLSAMNTSSSFTETKKLLVVIPDLITGGGERVTRQLIEVLASRGYSVRLVSDVTEQLLREMPLASYRRLVWRRGPERFLIIAHELFRCDRDTCVLAVLTGPIIAVSLLNLLFGRKVIAHEHSDIEKLYLGNGGIKRQIRLLALRAALQSVFSVAVVTDYLSERMPQALGFAGKKVAVVRNPVQPFLQKLICETTVNSSNSFTAYIIGRNSEEKRHREAIELLSSSPRIDRIILVALDALSLRMQLSPQANAKLIILDCLTDIDSFNTCSSFLFSYSAVESYSLVIAEWLASDLAVITVENEPMLRLWQYVRGCHFVPVRCSPADLEIVLTHYLDGKNTDSRDIFKPITIQSSADDLERLLIK